MTTISARRSVLRVSGAFPKRETRNPNVTGGANDMVDWLDRKRIIHLLRVAVNRFMAHLRLFRVLSF